MAIEGGETRPTPLERLRRHKGFSQTEMAQALGVTQATYSHYENGKTRMPAAVMRPLSRKLGLDLAGLYYALEMDDLRADDPDQAYDEETQAAARQLFEWYERVLRERYAWEAAGFGPRPRSDVNQAARSDVVAGKTPFTNGSDDPDKPLIVRLGGQPVFAQPTA